MLWYNLAQLLPPVYRAISAMKESADITNESLLEAVSIMERIQRNFFIQTCDETTLADWENRLQIELNELDTLAYRRKRVMAYLNNTTPYTETYWVEVLNMLIGEGEWTLTVQNNEIMLAVTDQTPEYRIKQMMNWASRVKPAHVAFLAGWRYTTEPINHIASSVLCGLSNSVLCKLPKVYVNLYSISNWGTFTQKAVFDPDDNKYIVNGVSYTLSGLITLGEVPNDGTITVYAVASEDESSAYKYTDRSDNVAKYFVQDGTHDFLSETELVESGWQLTQPAFGMIVGGTLAVTSEGETTLLRENWIGSLSRNITLESATVTTGTIDVQKSGTVYARSGSYQTLNGTLNAGATSVVYDSESNVSKEGETGAYVITSVYNNGGSAVAYDDLQLLVRSSDNKLVLVNNGETAISWCRLNYKIDPIATFELFIDD